MQVESGSGCALAPCNCLFRTRSNFLRCERTLIILLLQSCASFWSALFSLIHTLSRHWSSVWHVDTVEKLEQCNMRNCDLSRRNSLSRLKLGPTASLWCRLTKISIRLEEIYRHSLSLLRRGCSKAALYRWHRERNLLCVWSSRSAGRLRWKTESLTLK